MGARHKQKQQRKEEEVFGHKVTECEYGRQEFSKKEKVRNAQTFSCQPTTPLVYNTGDTTTTWWWLFSQLLIECAYTRQDKEEVHVQREGG